MRVIRCSDLGNGTYHLNSFCGFVMDDLDREPEERPEPAIKEEPLEYVPPMPKTTRLVLGGKQ